MNPKISIVTRAFNRLEYTIKCIDNISKITGYDNYEHLILNNNSTDGTKEWLNWIEKEKTDFFKKVKPVNLEKNYGDWGGMLKSLDYISKDSKYIVQLDNDIVIDDPEWLQKMIAVLEQGNTKICQLKRIGVGRSIYPQNKKTIEYNGEDVIFGNINRPVACFMLRTDDFIKVRPELKNTTLSSGKTLLSTKLGNTVKITNLNCYIIDGKIDENDKPYLNVTKYSRKMTHKNI